ncbi:MAG: hypothetical protein QOC80_378 [Frankiaceae bacterium]|jgi:hypothetical protein|nr:hypothetical protein [Frankiaceae bacterium]
MSPRQRLGVGLVAITVAAIPVVFFLVVVQNLILAVAAVVVELGLFTASRVALSRPQRPVGAQRFMPPSQR